MKLKKAFALLFILSLGLASCQSTTEEGGTSSPQSENQPSPPSRSPSKPLSRLDSLNQAIAEDSNSVAALAERAQYYLILNRDRDALFDLLRAKALDSNSADYLKVEGEYRMKLNQSRRARNAWRKCVNLHPEELACRLSLAKLYYTVGEMDQALKLLNEAIKQEPYLAEAYLFKGLIVRDKVKDTAKALSFFQQATELRQDYQEALDVLATTLLQNGDTLAPYYLQRLAELNPNDADIYYKLGVYHMNRDEINRAIEAYHRATQIDPKHSDSFYNLGFMFVRMSGYRDAKSYFNQAIQANPRSYKAHYGRGYCHEQLGDVINAEKDYRKTLELLPMYKPAMEGLNRLSR